jgi:hypothetical protein
MSKDNARQFLRELVQEVLDEMSATGAVGGYATPFAFRGHKSKNAAALRSMPGGKVVGTDEETDDTTVGETNGNIGIIRHGGKIAESRYSNFKHSDLMKNHAKISYGIKEAKKILREVDFLVSLCERLKIESGVDNNQLWKSTRPDLIHINRHLKEITRRIIHIGNK